MNSVPNDFRRRLDRVPVQGLGLSVDVYQPDLFELVAAAETREVPPDYLEIFKATVPALESVRRRLPDLPLQYHAEGLWLTQPDWTTAYPYDDELRAVAAQLRTLGCAWLTHECAAKQMAGYAFGTYLPPLYTEEAADVTAEHVRLAQARLDELLADGAGTSPLFLLEMPPLTYFGVGTLPIPDFFRRIVDRVACGLVLDIGHLWTVYRYTKARTGGSLVRFVGEFLEAFPLERVVQIHVAGLAPHERLGAGDDALPAWIDMHGAPIPPVLFDLLEQVLAHPRVTSLRGMALEVDTKPVPLIVEEFARFRARFGSYRFPREQQATRDARATQAANAAQDRLPPLDPSVRARTLDAYAAYARSVTQPGAPLLPMLDPDPRGLARYRDGYLPDELMHWGGAIADMFPATSRLLSARDISVETFVAFWNREPRPVTGPYDFFLLKIERFVAFVEAALPEARATVEQEARDLRAAYRTACEGVAAAAPALHGAS